jgi:Mg-chelatase subunit ChlD
MESFLGKIVELKLGKATHLWEAADEACEALIEYRSKRPANSRYRQRIIVISDGEGNGPPVSSLHVLQKVIANKMVLGAVMVSTQDFDENRELWAISRMSGGIACHHKVKISLSHHETTS